MFVFCFVLSVVYVFNDCFDVEQDCDYFDKWNWLVVWGVVSWCEVVVIVVGFVFVLFVVVVWVGMIVVGIVVVYFVLNVVYMFGFKWMLVVDVFVIVVGFMLWFFVGIFGIGVELL